MNRTALLAGTAILALAASGVLAGSNPGPISRRMDVRPHDPRGNTLYSQNGNYAYSILSQNFTSGTLTSYNAAGADDFVIPKGKTWKVSGVDVAGEYFYRAGPARSEVITFYKNDKGRPGIPVGGSQTLKCTDKAGSFTCNIKPVTLSGGRKGTRYWLSVVANCNYKKCGEWGWVQNATTHKDPGQWENPAGGLGNGCTSWNNTSSCFTQSGIVDDFAFDLRGKSN